jgi:hypothetical protein
MKSSRKRVIPKKRGRPATGNDPVRAFRLSNEFIATLDAWIAEQNDRPSRAEAIRRLVEIGLSTGKPQAQTPARTSAEAKRLAGQALDDLADPRASTAEQVDRKQDLIKGPEEFRSVRVDHRNKK